MKPINAVITMWAVHIGAVAALTVGFAACAEVPGLPCSSLERHLGNMENLREDMRESLEKFEKNGSWEAMNMVQNALTTLNYDIDKYTTEWEMKCETGTN